MGCVYFHLPYENWIVVVNEYGVIKDTRTDTRCTTIRFRLYMIVDRGACPSTCILLTYRCGCHTKLADQNFITKGVFYPERRAPTGSRT